MCRIKTRWENQGKTRVKNSHRRKDLFMSTSKFSKLDKHEVEMMNAQEEKESVSAVDCDGGASITHLGLSPDYVLSVRTSGHRRKLALETGHRVV